MQAKPKAEYRSRKRVDPVEVTLVRMKMLRLGWDKRELARRSGLSWSTIRQEFAFGFPEKKTRLRVDDALSQPILEGWRTWKKRKALAVRMGFDPFLETRTTSQKWATDHGIPFSRNGRILNKQELLDMLAHHLLQGKP